MSDNTRPVEFEVLSRPMGGQAVFLIKPQTPSGVEWLTKKIGPIPYDSVGILALAVPPAVFNGLLKQAEKEGII